MPGLDDFSLYYVLAGHAKPISEWSVESEYFYFKAAVSRLGAFSFPNSIFW
jgi:hypothetical protein